MPIVNRTVYTYDTLHEFNKRHLSFWRPLFIVLFSIVSVLMLLVLVLSFALNSIGVSTIVIAVAILLISLLRLLQYTVFWTRTIRKQAEEQVECVLRFTEDGIEESTTALNRQQTSHTDYAAVLKVTESEHAYYLYINRRAAHIVSKDGFVEGTEAELRVLLRERVEPRKLKLRA